MATANNAPLTNQGRADLRRVPTAPQNDFNQSRDSSISVVRASLIEFEGGEWEIPRFVPEVATGTAQLLCVFLWMTDRITSVSAKQFYSGDVYPASETAVPSLGSRLCTCATAFPTNGMADLPAGTTCTLLQDAEVGAQAVLAYGSGASALSVRGTPLLVEMEPNEYYGVPDEDQEPAPAEVRIEALSESLLSGKPTALFVTPTAGVYEPYAGVTSLASQQVVMNASDYVSGQYWLANNQLVVGPITYNIVGIYTAPVPPPT
jgi:hypothetical protein